MKYGMSTDEIAPADPRADESTREGITNGNHHPGSDLDDSSDEDKANGGDPGVTAHKDASSKKKKKKKKSRARHCQHLLNPQANGRRMAGRSSSLCLRALG